MSARALRLAVRNVLRSIHEPGGPTLLIPNAESCEIVVDGRPPAFAGQRFVGIHAGDWSNTANESLDERVGLKVTITDRMGVFPFDRQAAEALDKAQTGLETFAEAIVCVIHGSNDVIDLANTIIQGTVTKFIEPLRFRFGERPVYRDGTWLGAEDPEADAGLSITLTFGDARRVQKFEDIAYELFE